MAKALQRLFFALWPENPVRDQLIVTVQQLQKHVAARWIDPENFHITLAFLGDVATGRLPDLNQAAEAVSSVCLELSLDRIEHWRKAQVICLTPSANSPVLAQLAADLTNQLRLNGFALETRPFRAHLTLARKATDPRMAFCLEQPIRWTSSAFVLVASSPISQYTILQSWPLREPVRQC